MNEQINRALQDMLNNPQASYDQLKQLTQLAGDYASESLAICMRDGDERLREMAASYFFQLVRENGLADTSAVPIIIEAVKKEDNPLAKRDMIAVLGLLGDSRAFDVIIATLSEQIIEDYALEALGDLGDNRALPVLLKYLHHECWDYRVSAALGLGRVGHPVSINALVTHLDDHAGNDQITVSKACAIALERIGTDDAMAALADWQKN